MVSAIRGALAITLAIGSAQALSGQGAIAYAGVGAGLVTKSEGGGSDVSPTVNVGLGVPVAGLRLGIEAALAGTLDETPRPSDVQGDTPHDAKVFQTALLMLTVEVPLSRSWYARPGAGVGRHAFATYLFYPNEGAFASTSHEVGIAAGLTVGGELSAGRFPLAIEAGLAWSGGEDSSAARTVASLRVVARPRL
jgi:hypothetical protein